MRLRGYFGTAASWVALLLAGAAAPGCGEELGEATTTVSDGLFINPNVPLFTTNNYTVPICFLPDSDVSADVKTDFQNTLNAEWGAKTGVTFTGFGTCTSLASPNVPVYMYNGANHGDWGGNGQEGVGARHGDGMCANDHSRNCQPATKDVDCKFQNATCVTGSQLRMAVAPDRNNFHAVSVHEIGHVLGIQHEHQRPDGDDTSNRCVIPRNGGDSVILDGQNFGSVEDPVSIMNYCNNINGRTFGDPTLTAQDVAGGQLMYGRPPTATGEAGFAFVAFNTVIPPANQWNTTAAANTVNHFGPGSYQVTMPRNGRWGGNVQVTARSGGNRCKVTGWASGGGTGAVVSVQCFTPAGVAADTDFTTSFVGRSDTPGPEGGYVWAYDATSASYTPTPTSSYAWNSTGQAINITHSTTGVYTVTFKGQNWSGGTAEVTAYGSGSEYCKLDSLSRVNTDKQVIVRCFTTTGVPANTLYSLRLSRVSPEGAPSYSFAIADQPSNTNPYTPAAAHRVQFRGSPSGGSTGLFPMTVTRTGVGSYSVNMPQMLAHQADNDPNLYKKNTVNVVAVGTGAEYCTIVGWSGNNDIETNIGIGCYNAAGVAADSQFMINYASLLLDLPQPKTIATIEREGTESGQGEGGMVLINGNIYFTRSFANVPGGQIRRISPSGGTPTVVVSGQHAVGLAGDANNLFWAVDTGGIKKSTLAGGSITTVVASSGAIGSLAIDANNVYYTVAAQQMGTARNIMKVSRNGGTPVVLTGDAVGEMVSDGTSLYWSGFGRIAKIPVGGGPVTQLATRSTSASSGAGLALRSGMLYYADANNDIYKVPVGGGTPTLLATNLPVTGYAYFMTSDGSNVYGVIRSVDPVIFKVGVNSTPDIAPTYLAWRQYMHSPIVWDASNVYTMVDTAVDGWHELHSMPK